MSNVRPASDPHSGLRLAAVNRTLLRTRPATSLPRVFGSDRTNEDRTMPIYRIEQYEIHVQGYNVTADSEADAISRLFMGEGDPIDNSLEFVEIADDHGMR